MVATFRSKEVLVPGEVAPLKLQDLIKAMSDDLLDRGETPDWCNNEGGYGTLEWQVNPDGSDTLDVTVNQCVREYETTVLTYDRLGEMTGTNNQGRSD